MKLLLAALLSLIPNVVMSAPRGTVRRANVNNNQDWLLQGKDGKSGKSGKSGTVGEGCVGGLTPPAIRCTCHDCTDLVWDALTGDVPNRVTCGALITDLMVGEEAVDEVTACRSIAGVDLPAICGGCNPDLCDGRRFEDQDWEPLAFLSAPFIPVNPPQDDEDDLFCFPPIEDRLRFENAFSKNFHPGYIVDVKERTQFCGPGDNRFSRSGVSMSADGQELTLEYALNAETGAWEASEVRILLPDQSAYGYGTFEFGIKSMETISGGTVTDGIPSSLVVGMFTWDPTEDFTIRENFNHDQGIEISQSGNGDWRDVEYFMQPLNSSQTKHRFYSGRQPIEGVRNSTFAQDESHLFSFHWDPAYLEWRSQDGEIPGHAEYDDARVHYTSAEYSLFYEALGFDKPDFVQCLPANVEARVNLWSRFGLETVPGLADDTIVRVVIDHFSFRPSPNEHVDNGGYCTQHCQCDYPTSLCIDGICRSSGSNDAP